MAISFQQRFRKLVKWAGGLFLIMFFFRLMYGYVVTSPSGNTENGSDFFSTVDHLRKNYASEKMVKKTDIAQQASAASSQKYEKTASLRSKTGEWDTDEQNIRNATRSFDAIIQYEQQLGQKGKRELHLLIGVNPAVFDSFYAAVQKIGDIKSQEVTKVDKTNEYRELNAKKASLEKTLASLNELKSRGGEIGDYITLHDKILEIETLMQGLGVELGNFDTENEFCTVRFSLYEGETAHGISMTHRVKVALEWTIKYYLLLMTGLAGTMFGAFLLLLILDKLGAIKAMRFPED